MSQNNKNNILGYERLPRLLQKFAVPSIIAMLVSSLYNIVDQIFIGQGVGYLGNAATNVAFPLTTICMAFALLIGIGSASKFSLWLGEKKEERAAKVVANAIMIMIIVGICYMVVIELLLRPLLTAFGATPEVMPYAISYTRITAVGMPFLIIVNCMSSLARADGSPKYSMMCMLIGAIVNTVLDPIFIFGFDLGVAGAAWATIIGQIVSFFFAIRYAKHFKQVKLKREYFKFNKGEIRECLQFLSLGISSSLNQVALTFVQIVLNNGMTAYGENSIYGSDIPLAACGIVMKTNAIWLAVIIGISQGSQPIVGFNYGAKQYDRVRGTYKLAITCNFIVSIVAFLLFQLCPRQILSIFGTGGDALYFEFAVKFMRIFLLFVIVNGVQIISSNFFSAIGKPLKGLILSMTRQVIFLIPLAIILPIFLGLDGILYSGPIADAAAFVVAVFLVMRQMSQMKKMEAEMKGLTETAASES